MGARSRGANAPYSFLYSFVLSTFFWEYGVEAFAEVPSKQDLIITPVVGSILGEGFYLAKRNIVSNDYELLNSKFFGHFVLYLIDPITEVANLFIDKPKETEHSFLSYPTFSSSKGFGYNVVLNFKF
jgi:hypothetical protein